MDIIETVQSLRTIPLFAGLDLPKLKLLAFAAEYQEFHAEEYIIRAGEPSDSVYLILEGAADVIGIDDAGDELCLSTLGKDALVGELGVIRNATRISTIRATGALKALRIEGHLFLKMVTENPEAAFAVLKVLSEKLVLATERLEAAESRVAGADGDG